MRLTPQSESGKFAVYITGVMLVAAFLLLTPRSPGIAPVLAQVSSCGNAVLEPGEQCDPPGDSCGGSFICDANCQCPTSSSCGNAILDPGEECDPPTTGTSTQCPSSPAGSFLTCTQTCTCCNPVPEICGNTTDDDCDGLIDCQDPQCAGQPPCIRRDPSRILFDVRPVGLDLLTSHGKVNADGVSVAGKKISWKVTNARGTVYEGTLQPGDFTSGHNKNILRFRDPAARFGQGTHDGIFKAKIQVGARGTISYHVKAYGDMSSADDPAMALHFTIGSGPTGQAWGTSGNWKRTKRGWVAGKAQLVGFN